MFKYQNNHNMKKSMYLIVISLLTGLTGLQSQEAVIELTFTATYQGQHVALDSILIQNLSQNCEMMTADTVIALDYVTGAYNKPVSGKESLQVSQNHPNPFTGQTMITIHLPGSDHLRVSVTNLFGQRVALFEQKLEAGSHSFIFYPGNDRYYVLSATVPGAMDVIKMINLGGQTSQSVSLHYQGAVKPGSSYKSAIGSKEFSFSLGDTLRFTGYANTPTFSLGSSEIEDAPEGNQTYTFNIVEGIRCPGTPTVTDFDGNVYNTVLIGEQCWMKENLKTTTYKNDTPIPNVTDNTAWENLTTGAYVWYDNDINWKDSYGSLYNWFTTVDPNGLCPTGWHVPTHIEWTALTDHIGGIGSPNGNKLKSCRQVNSPLGGGCNTSEHPRWNQHSTHYGTDDYGFSGLPGGHRGGDGFFYDVGSIGFWWSSTEYSSTNAWGRYLGYSYGYVTVGYPSKRSGFSIRCLRDSAPSAAFTAEPTSGAAPLAVNFTDQSTNTPTSWQWSFGDGGTSTQQNPAQTYQNPGSYTVQLTVTNSYGSDTEIKTNYITVTSGGGTGEPCPGVPTVTYEGQVYNTVLIGSQCWLKENLNVGTMINGSQNQTNNGTIEKYCYDDNTANCEIYGGLYQWNEMMGYSTTPGVQGICPPGWHIPTDDEWKILEGTVDSQYGVGDPIWDNWGYRGFDAGKNLKSTTGWDSGGNGTDLYGFGALPGGNRITNGLFWYLGLNGQWWSSSEISGTYAWTRRLYTGNDGSYRNGDGNTYGFSVRCLKDN
jgi:uncharacterized protein (TIGR02145 family)